MLQWGSTGRQRAGAPPPRPLGARGTRGRDARAPRGYARGAPESGRLQQMQRRSAMWQKLKETKKPILLYGMGDGAEKILTELN